MDKLRQHERGQREAISLLLQFANPLPHSVVVGMLRDFCCDEKTRVESVSHARPSSISSYHSSRIAERAQHLPKIHGFQIQHAVRILPVLFLPYLPDKSLQFRQFFDGQLGDNLFDFSERAHTFRMRVSARGVKEGWEIAGNRMMICNRAYKV